MLNIANSTDSFPLGEYEFNIKQEAHCMPVRIGRAWIFSLDPGMPSTHPQLCAGRGNAPLKRVPLAGASEHKSAVARRVVEWHLGAIVDRRTSQPHTTRIRAEGDSVFQFICQLDRSILNICGKSLDLRRRICLGAVRRLYGERAGSERKARFSKHAKQAFDVRRARISDIWRSTGKFAYVLQIQRSTRRKEFLIFFSGFLKDFMGCGCLR